MPFREKKSKRKALMHSSKVKFHSRLSIDSKEKTLNQESLGNGSNATGKKSKKPHKGSRAGFEPLVLAWKKGGMMFLVP